MPGVSVPENIGSLQRPVLAVTKPFFRLLWRVSIEGLEHVPKHGGALVCPNHLSVFDSFLLPSVMRRPLTFVGKSEYLDDWKTRRLFPALGMIPLDRRGGEHAAASLDAARRVLLAGGLFAIYPEGTRSRDGHLHRGHTGAARLAIETGCPIVPVGISGTPEIQPPDQTLPRPFRRATIRFGVPIGVERYRARIGDRALYREVIDEVMFEIAQLSGQTYVDRYAGQGASPTPDASIPERSSEAVLVHRPLREAGF